MNKNMAADATVDAIERFIARQADLSSLNDFDEALRGREQRLPQRKGSTPAEELAWLLYDLTKNHFFMLRVGSLKLAKIAEGIRWAIQAENPTVQISLVRSLLEHTAALAFQMEELRGLQYDLSRQGGFNKLKDAVHRHQSILKRRQGERQRDLLCEGSDTPRGGRDDLSIPQFSRLGDKHAHHSLRREWILVRNHSDE